MGGYIWERPIVRGGGDRGVFAGFYFEKCEAGDPYQKGQTYINTRNSAMGSNAGSLSSFALSAIPTVRGGKARGRFYRSWRVPDQPKEF
jgi:hypothetical protein